MRKTKFLLLLVLCMALLVCFVSCMDEEDYHTKTDTEALLKTLETSLTERIAANEKAIADLKTDYEAKIADLETEDEALTASLAALTADYEAKVAALNAADTAIRSELATLSATHNTAVTELNGKIAANATALAQAKTDFQNALDTLSADCESELAKINTLITALQNADTASEARIAELEKQVAELLSAHKHTFGGWVNFRGNENVYCENRLFYRICATCRVLEWMQGSEDSHVYQTVTTAPTCQAEGCDTHTCDTCGKVVVDNYTAKSAHQWQDTYSHDGSYHWYDCKHCDAVDGKAEHTVDTASGYCTVCNQPISGSEGLMYELSADGTYAEVIAYTGTATRIVIADTYMGKPVTAIYKETFKNKGSIVSVYIPASVTSIGEGAFRGCTGLTSITIPAGVTSIGEYAFSNCDSLTSITIPAGVTSIGTGAFQGCTGLTSITIPADSAITFGLNVFYDCTKLPRTQYGNCNYVGTVDNPYYLLESVVTTAAATYTIHEETKAIAGRAFYGCTRMQSITIPAGVTSIGFQAFYGCTGLTSITIPAGVTSIGSQAFYGCTGLISITIPASVTSIGTWAFYDCTGLKEVYYGGTAEDWAGISIDGSNYSLTSATRYYYSETKPTISYGNYWHYVDGEIVVWDIGPDDAIEDPF